MKKQYSHRNGLVLALVTSLMCTASLRAQPSVQGQWSAAPEFNGYWELDVATSGQYQITLRERPEEASYPIKAVKAEIEVAGRRLSTGVKSGDEAVSFELKLKSGRTRLQSWFTGKDGTSRGAYYATVTKL